MDYQECIWKGKIVWVVSIMSKNMVIHRYLKNYIGKGGYVIGTAKNNMLLVEFDRRGRLGVKYRHHRCIPSSCVVEYGKCKSGVKSKS